MPRAAHEGRFGPKRFNSQVREVELAHLFTSALVSFAIAFQRRLPAGGDLCARVEGQFWRIPVPSHKTLQVLRVPSLNLPAQDLLNSALGRTVRSLSNDCRREKKYQS